MCFLRLLVTSCAGLSIILASAGTLLAGGTLTPRPAGTLPGTNIGFYEYLPEDYGISGSSWPLLVFYHGIGENGSGSAEDLEDLLSTGLPQLLNQGAWPPTPPGGEQEADRFVILAPQSANGFPGASTINDFIDFSLQNYDIDPERVYLTGLSAGGITIFNYLKNNYQAGSPDRIAATLPIAGNGIPTIPQACLYAHIPVWAFHGSNDGIVTPDGSILTIEAVNACEPPPPNGHAKVTIFPGGGHSGDVWNRVWNLSRIGTGDPLYDPFDGSVFDWLLQYRRGGIQAPIFEDGFESGDLSAWSSTTP